MVLLLCGAPLLTACMSSPIKMVQSTNRTVINYPALDVVVTKGLGERLVAKGIQTKGEAIEVTKDTQFNKSEGESSIMTCAVSVAPGSFFKKGYYEAKSTKADCYGPVPYRLTLSDGSTNFNCPGNMNSGDICRDSDGKYFLAFLNAKIQLKQDYENIKVVDKVIEESDNFVQEIVYNGRVGNNCKFIYREFSNDMARPAFTQEVQYDLSDSKIVGFKSLRLEIVNASNTEITYKLISNF